MLNNITAIRQLILGFFSTPRYHSSTGPIVFHLKESLHLQLQMCCVFTTTYLGFDPENADRVWYYIKITTNLKV